MQSMPIERIKKQLLDQSSPIPPDAFGIIYALKDTSNNVVYIGQASDKLSAFGRIKTHLLDKNFSTWSMVEVPKCRMNEVEKRLIFNLQPKYNITYKDGDPSAVEVLVINAISLTNGLFTIAQISNLVLSGNPEVPTTSIERAFHRVRGKDPSIVSAGKQLYSKLRL